MEATPRGVVYAQRSRHSLLLPFPARTFVDSRVEEAVDNQALCDRSARGLVSLLQSSLNQVADFALSLLFVFTATWLLLGLGMSHSNHVTSRYSSFVPR